MPWLDGVEQYYTSSPVLAMPDSVLAAQSWHQLLRKTPRYGSSVPFPHDH